jgi:hypothetical protein
LSRFGADRGAETAASAKARDHDNAAREDRAALALQTNQAAIIDDCRAAFRAIVAEEILLRAEKLRNVGRSGLQQPGARPEP